MSLDTCGSAQSSLDNLCSREMHWVRGVDEAALKSFEKQLNLPVACYSNVSKWYVDGLVLDRSAVL